jgi:glutaredoxin
MKNALPQRALLLALLALPTMGALAQYKVVRPDGSVTYTDRPPVEPNVRVTPIGRNAAGGGSPESSLPAELRQAMSRYPVTLYTTADCGPCDNGRRLLQTRGVPYIERRITTEEDAQALERLVGGRTVPALTVGAQQLRGLAEGDWTSYLDAAGYPRESKLPRNWPVPMPTPLVERTAAAPAPTPARPAPAEPRGGDEIQPTTGVRF